MLWKFFFLIKTWSGVTGNGKSLAREEHVRMAGNGASMLSLSPVASEFEPVVKVLQCLKLYTAQVQGFKHVLS